MDHVKSKISNFYVLEGENETKQHSTTCESGLCVHCEWIELITHNPPEFYLQGFLLARASLFWYS